MLPTTRTKPPRLFAFRIVMPEEQLAPDPHRLLSRASGELPFSLIGNLPTSPSSPEPEAELGTRRRDHNVHSDLAPLTVQSLSLNS